MSETPNHGYKTPARGTTNWHLALNENFENIDQAVEIRDTEANKGEYEPKEGAKYEATDSGAIYHGNGTSWVLADRQVHSFQSDVAAVNSFNNEVNVYAMEGDTLDERVVNALDRLDTSGTIKIPRPPGGGEWDWTSQVDINASDFQGVTLDIARGTVINCDVSGWVMTVTGDPSARNRTQLQTFEIDGTDAEFEFRGNQSLRKSNGGVHGFVRSDDVPHVSIHTCTRGFNNGDGDATPIVIRNVKHFTEGWKLSGDHRDCNRGVDFVPASVTRGSGTDSFVDGRAVNLSVASDDFGVRLRGNHRGNVFDNCHFFPKSRGAVGLVLDGIVSGTTFLGPRFDDTVDVPNDVGIRTDPDFDEWFGKPIFIGPQFNRISTEVDQHSPDHEITIIE